MPFRIVLALLLGLWSAACSEKPIEDRKHFDFQRIHWFAERASAAYQSDAEIRQAFPNVRYIATTPRQVKYFLEQDPAQSVQIIVVRGTDNLANVKEDADYVELKNTSIGIYVHQGFDEEARVIFEDLLPRVDKDLPIKFSGHSLGAAISSLLMIYFEDAGYRIGESVNFGQPKFTNKQGAQRYRQLPLLRVVDRNDVVPLLPPLDLVDSVHGPYEHLGQELILLDKEYYVFLDQHIAREQSLSSFWERLGDESVSQHRMAQYLLKIESKLKTSKQVPYSEREQYSQ